jgi:ribosome-binding ATPase
LKAALLGLMQSGKSTIIAAISGKKIPPAGSVQIEEVIVPVPDERIEWLNDLYEPKKKVYATIDCLDLPGVSFADEHTRAAAQRLINKIRTVDMLVLVLKAFEQDGIAEAKKDLAQLKTELLLADLEMVETRIDRLEKQKNKPSKDQAKDKAEYELQLKLRKTLEDEKSIRDVIETDAELELIKSLGFLTLKPISVVVNISEALAGENFDRSVFLELIDESTPAVALCAELEDELRQLDDSSRAEFMADMGITEPAVNKFVQSCYSALGLISFLTVGKDEVRAWPIISGTAAVDAAGKIHSDIQRGFIRAETMSYKNLKELGNEKAVKAAGKARLEGKNYIVQDGDIINFRFNV